MAVKRKGVKGKVKAQKKPALTRHQIIGINSSLLFMNCVVDSLESGHFGTTYLPWDRLQAYVESCGSESPTNKELAVLILVAAYDGLAQFPIEDYCTIGCVDPLERQITLNTMGKHLLTFSKYMEGRGYIGLLTQGLGGLQNCGSGDKFKITSTVRAKVVVAFRGLMEGFAKVYDKKMKEVGEWL